MASIATEQKDGEAVMVDNDKVDRVAKLFAEFDADGSGSIDSKEFQDLAFACGETLSDEEAVEVTKQLDTDGNGTIDVDEFRNWFEGFNRDDSESNSVANLKSSVIRTKLAARYMKRKIERKLKKASDAGVLKQESTSTAVRKMSASVQIGNMDAVKMRSTITVSKPPQILLDGIDGNSMIAWTLACKADATDLQVGALAGTIESLYSVASQVIPLDMFGKFDIKPCDCANGRKGLRVTFTSQANAIMEDIPIAEAPVNPFDCLKEMSMTCGVGCDFNAMINQEDPTMNVADFVFNAVDFNMSCELSTQALENTKDIIDQMGDMVPKEVQKGMAFLMLFLEGSVSLKLGDVYTFLKVMGMAPPEDEAQIGKGLEHFKKAQSKVLPMVAGIAGELGIDRAAASSMYKTVSEALAGFDELCVVSSVGAMLTIKYENVNPFEHLLPEHDEAAFA